MMEENVGPTGTNSVDLVLRGRDFGLQSDTIVRDFTIGIDVTAEVPLHADVHAYTWHETGSPDSEPDPDRTDAVFISGLNSDAHDYLSAVGSMKKRHTHMAFIGHTDAASSSGFDPEVPFNKNSFAPSGEAFLLTIEKLAEAGEIQRGVTVYTHSTGAAVCLEAIALDEKRAREEKKPRLIKQAVLVAPAGIVDIGDKDAVNKALAATMKQAFVDEWYRAKADRSSEWNAGKAMLRILTRAKSDEYTGARNFREFLGDVMTYARKKEWSSVVPENTVIEIVEYVFEHFAMLEDTAQRFHLYWPDMLPHAWPKTPSALHNMELITTNITDTARNAISDTPIVLVFFDEDRLVQMKKILSAEDVAELSGLKLSQQEATRIRMQGSRLLGIYDRRLRRNPDLTFAAFQDDVYKLLTALKRGRRERDLISLRAKELFPQNKPNVSAEYIAFTNHMSQRRHGDDIMAIAKRILKF